MRHLSHILDAVLADLQDPAANVVDITTERARRNADLQAELDREMERRCRVMIRAMRHVTAALSDRNPGSYRRSARRIRMIYEREFQHPVLHRAAEVLRTHASTRGGPVPSPSITVARCHEVNGQDILTYDLGPGSWAWQLDRTVPRPQAHGLFESEEEALEDAAGELR